MEIKAGPDPVEEPSLQYKLQRKLKLFNESPLANHGYNLVSASSKYGLVFVGTPSATLRVYYLKDLINKECENPPHLNISLPEPPSHVVVNFNQEILAVVCGQIIQVYQISKFREEVVKPSAMFECKATPGTYVTSIAWHPTSATVLALCCYDGMLMMCIIGQGDVERKQVNARCVCWSPKGKQMVVGNSDGSIAQYQLNLTLVKTIPAPNLFEGNPVEVLAIHWVSNYQFGVVYKNSADDTRPCVTIVNAAKAGPVTCLNYDDVCFSTSSIRPWYYYLQNIAQWNMILASSSNGMEIATLGSTDSSNWFQWCQTDEARPELPLTDKKQENYPIGLALDTCAIHQLPWGENSQLPYMPILHVLSHSGMLVIFNVINLKQGAPQICTPPEQFQLPANKIITSTEVESVPIQPKSIAAPTPSLPVPSYPQSVSASGSIFAQANAQLSQTSTPNLPPAFAAPPPAFPRPEAKAEIKPAAPVPVPQKVEPAAADPHQEAVSAAQQAALAAQQQKRKSEQEKAAIEKANKELKEMLVKEANDFQMELYNFMQKARAMDLSLDDGSLCDASVKLHAMDGDALRNECSLESLRATVMQLKLELVRTCAVVAEARSHAQSQDAEQFTLPDPLTAKRLSNIKKLVYYVQNQLEQAHKALDLKWADTEARSPSSMKDRNLMARPALEDVYQPLVKQQEILARQQALLKSLKTALADSSLPIVKTPSLLRSTPFRNKDPLSKLTKNILNMSLESDSKKCIKPTLTANKLESLREALSNHKTVRIKPVNIEIRHHLDNLQKNHERYAKERSCSADDNKPVVDVSRPPATITKVVSAPQTSIPTPVAPMVIPTKATDNAGKRIEKVIRTLFTDDQEDTKTPPKPQPPAVLAPVQPNAVQSKTCVPLVQQAKNDENTLLGLKICSPTVTVPVAQQKTPLSVTFGVKPNTGSFATPETKPTAFGQPLAKPAVSIFPITKPQRKPASLLTADNSQSAETGEPEAVPKTPVSGGGSFDFGSLGTSKDDKSKTAVAFTGKGQTIGAFSGPGTANAACIFSGAAKTDNGIFGAVKVGNTGSIFGAASKDTAASGFSAASVFKAVKTTEVTAASTSKSLLIDSSKNAQENKDAVKNIEPTAEQPKLEKSKSKENIGEVRENQAADEAGKVERPKGAEKPSEVVQPSISLSPVSPAGTGSIFGQTSTANESRGTSIFGSTSVVASTTVSSPVTTSAPSLPTKTPLLPTPTSAVAAVAPPVSVPIFGTAAPSSPVPQSPSTPPAAPSSDASSIFAAANAATAVTTAVSIFGTPSTPLTTTSIFGAPSTPPAFGAPGTPPAFGTPATTAPSLFGTPTPASPAAVFASANAAAPGFGTGQTVFGSPSQAQPSVFGTPTTTSQSPFGSPEANLFASATISTTTSGSPNVGNIFGGSSASPGASNVFGGKTTFGQTNTAAASIFGGGASFGQQKQQNNFWGNNNTPQSGGFGSSFGSPKTQASSIFGGGSGSFSSPSTQSQPFGSQPASGQTSIFGGSPQAAAPAFGGSPVFGTKSVFGQSSGFGGSPSSGGFGAFSSGAGGGNVAQSGFGAPAAFGAKPPAFGTGTAFGAAPAFGGAPAFGSTSPGKMFGGSSPGFGSPTQQNATFENLATQNTLTFGNLAQQSPQQTQQPQSFNTSPSFTGWRG